MTATLPLRIQVNGRSYEHEVEPRKTLADFLRDELGLKGTHLSCEHGFCGNCNVLVDGETIRSCLMFAIQARGREAHADDQLARLERRLVRAQEERARRNRSLARRRPDVDCRVECDGGGSQLGPRCREGERAADGAAATRLLVTDEPGGLPQQRPPGGDELVLEQALLADERAHVELSLALLQDVEPGDTVQVDQRARLHLAELHQLDEALAARQRVRAVSAGEQLQRLLDGGRRVILEGRRLHRPAFSR